MSIKLPKHIRVLDNRTLLKAAGIKYRYEPRGASRDLFHCHDKEILLVGPAGTGKSLSILQKIHLILGKYPGAKAFMSRKTRTSMTNSCLDMFQRHVLKPADRVRMHKQDQQFNYPNGSLLAIIGLDDPERIKSTEWDVGYIQEATECSENDWEMCTSRMRNFVVPYQQLIGDCNPDKPTHWLKKRCDKGQTTMMISYHEDNPVLFDKGLWTEKGLIYRATLDKLSGARRSRLYLGQWVAAEGLVYENWDPQIHMINLHDLPPTWPQWDRYWSIDWGFTHPFVWKEWSENPETGQLIRTREIYQTKMIVEDLAKWIMDLTGGVYQPRAIICDHDPGDRATFERHTGYMTLPAYKEIRPGIQAVEKRLRHDWCKNGPGLLYLRDALVNLDLSLKEAGLPTCTEEEYDGYVWDKGHNEEVNSKKDELPVDKSNHGMDSDRYMVAFIDNLADDPEDLEGVLMLGQSVRISPY
jgi:phage terminase large subunit